MLSRLYISNYALIDSLDISFDNGLSIITGETGAGKSIMLGALSMLMGGRADMKVIADRSRRSVIEAVFTDIPDNTLRILRELDTQWEGVDLIVRRELSPSGRSRAFINDSPVNLAALSAVTSTLLDIHSQHSNIALFSAEGRLELLDAIAGNAALLAEYRRVFRRYVELRKEIRRLRSEADSARASREAIEFQLEELDKLNPRRGELRQVERLYDMLSDAEDIGCKLRSALALLEGGNGNILASLSEVSEVLESLDFDIIAQDSDAAIPERLRQVRVELKDIAEWIGSHVDYVESDPHKLAKVTARMNALISATRRFKTDGDGLVDLRDQLRKRLAAIDGGHTDANRLDQEARLAAAELRRRAEEISSLRKEAAGKICGEVSDYARTLGLPHLQFSIDLTPAKPGINGADAVEFLVSFNLGHPLVPMASVASGGELARMMLSLKRVSAGYVKMPTVIFDEIDTGVSGDIADRMGSMMASMGETIQVMTITHLPQVAAKGSRHYHVYKQDRDGRTVSSIRLLSEDERECEIARMLSGREIDQASLENARSLLSQGRPRD